VRYLYTLLMSCLTPYLLFRLWWKGRHVPAYRQRIGERFSIKFAGDETVDIWVHAVSLGEVIAATVMIEKLIAKNHRVLVTTMTPTGSDRVQRHFGNKVVHQYLPYDLPWVVNKFLQHYQPRIGVIMETELWPNLIGCAHAQHVPMVLVNGRLSQQSYEGYRRAKGLFQPVLNELTSILVQTEEDKARFVQLGASEALVRVMGNMKFDADFFVKDADVIQGLKIKWGVDRVVLMLASTHENEEQLFLDELGTLQAMIPDLLLMIAPRHPERFEKVFQLSQNKGFKTGRRTRPEQIDASVQVMVMDSLGELMAAYACCDYAFVGGSLVPVGGHNVLEPIALGKPVFSGRQVHNFKAIFETLVAAKAVQMIDSVGELINTIRQFQAIPGEKTAQVERAQEMLARNRGVIQKYIEEIEVNAKRGPTEPRP
jgi:3-deoxy-D-manno-octulosonic-acid transferase